MSGGAAGGDFGGRVALVTGAASGIGREVARGLARGGARLAVADMGDGRTGDAAAALMAEFPGCEALPCPVDVRRPEEVDAMIAAVVGRFGALDILVASAGILRGVPGRPQTVADTTADAWDKVIDTNLTGVFLTNRAALREMIRHRRGDIVNLSSMSGRRGHALDAAYCASKFGVIGLSEVLQEEARPYGVRVQVVLPEVVDTPMLDQNGPLFRPKDTLTAERVAELILYLLALPPDTLMLGPAIAPFQARR
jgi:NAD(P)-dependent dehydrogenase (short-subunit alcohol dehydrogenase family)